MIWSLLVGAFIGWIGSILTNKNRSMGWIANILAGLIGSAVGQSLFGHWGPRLAGMAIICTWLSYSNRCCIIFLWKKRIKIFSKFREFLAKKLSTNVF